MMTAATIPMMTAAAIGHRHEGAAAAMTHILLTGAGFSRNWGGWLANEAFEYLLGCSEIDQPLRELLWQHSEIGDGFEGALAELQANGARQESLGRMESAVAGMFNLMNSGLGVFDHNHRRFLARFDAIFTLNDGFRKDIRAPLMVASNRIGSCTAPVIGLIKAIGS